MDIEKIIQPTLVMSQVADGCSRSPAMDGPRLADKIGASRKAFVELKGGGEPQSPPCEGRSHHGYIGQEEEAVGVIRRFTCPVAHEGLFQFPEHYLAVSVFRNNPQDGFGLLVAQRGTKRLVPWTLVGERLETVFGHWANPGGNRSSIVPCPNRYAQTGRHRPHLSADDFSVKFP